MANKDKDAPARPEQGSDRVPWRGCPRACATSGRTSCARPTPCWRKIREVYERYGFEPLETPAFEYTDALGKFLPDQDRSQRGRVLVSG